MTWVPTYVHDCRFENIYVERCRGSNRQRLIDFTTGDSAKAASRWKRLKARVENIEAVDLHAAELTGNPSIVTETDAGFTWVPVVGEMR